MSLEAAAAAMGLPETLVQRSAEARAAETGASVDDILAAWAGDAPPPAAAEPPEPSGEDEAAPDAAPEEPAPVPEVVVDVPAAVPADVPAAVVAAGPYKPPVLVGDRDNPMAVLAGVVGLFVLVLLVGLIGPSIQAETPGSRSSDIPYSEAAVSGQDIYLNLGCQACHSQMVRPVIADVGLGAVTLNDSNQALGTRRFGPDLSNVGARITDTQLQAIVEGLGGHPSYGLSSQDMGALVAYLSQSVTAEDEE